MRFNKLLPALFLAVSFMCPVHAEVLTDEVLKSFQRPAEIPYPEDNAHTDEKYELGRMLFFDPRLFWVQLDFMCKLP